MTNEPLSESVLQAFLDDLLSEKQMIEIEHRLRSEPTERDRLTALITSRDQGTHSIGEIWRRHRISCPSREDLGSYLLGALMDEHIAYIDFHIRHVGCRFCQSNLDDLRRLQTSENKDAQLRRDKYFHSSVGRLPST